MVITPRSGPYTQNSRPAAGVLKVPTGRICWAPDTGELSTCTLSVNCPSRRLVRVGLPALASTVRQGHEPR